MDRKATNKVASFPQGTSDTNLHGDIEMETVNIKGQVPPKSKTSTKGVGYDNMHYAEHLDQIDHAIDGHHDLDSIRTSHMIHGDQRPIYYIVDSESLHSGKAVIDIKDKTANASPLGLLGFGLTTFLLNMANAGVFELNSMVLAMGLCYGGLAQIIAGIFEFKRGNLFGMIAFMSYGFFWFSLVVTFTLPAMGLAAPPDQTSIGWYMFIWGVFSLGMFIGTLIKRTPLALSFVFLTVVLLFALLASANFMQSTAITKVAGIEGIICGLSAIYLAIAEIWNELSGGRTILPIFVRK